MSLEQQRAAVHQQFSLVADNIFGMLETLMDEYEAEISSSHRDMEHPARPTERTDICTAGLSFILYSQSLFFQFSSVFVFLPLETLATGDNPSSGLVGAVRQQRTGKECYLVKIQSFNLTSDNVTMRRELLPQPRGPSIFVCSYDLQ